MKEKILKNHKALIFNMDPIEKYIMLFNHLWGRRFPLQLGVVLVYYKITQKESSNQSIFFF